MRTIYFWRFAAETPLEAIVTARVQGAPKAPSRSEPQFPATQRAMVNTLCERLRKLTLHRYTNSSMLISYEMRLILFAVLLSSQVVGQPASSVDRIPPANVWSSLQPYLLAAGDRYYKPGNERIVASGTISRGAAGTPSPIQITWEFPGKIRIEEGSTVTIFNSASAGAPGQLSQAQSDTVESLVEDTFDGFLTAHAGEASTRVIGTRFPWTGRPGQFWDIVQITAKSTVKRNAAASTKEFRFDSRAKLLATSDYVNESKVRVEVTFSNWQKVQGQMVPASIVRTENGAMAFSITLSSIVTTGKANDGKFGN